MALRAYQTDAVNAIFNYFYNATGNPVVAMPTGTGKSHVIAGFTQQAMHYWPRTRVMMLTHVKELIEQNAEKLREAWPTAPMGIYSAGLGEKISYMPITFGGVASVVKVIEQFGHIDLLIIDECHLLSPSADTMYQAIIETLKKTNPYLKVIGLSATPYRLGQGMITDGGVFTDICIDMTTLQAFNWFIDQAYMTTLIPYPTGSVIDAGELQFSGGDYQLASMEREFDKIMYDALREVVTKGHDRRSWLIFAPGVTGAEKAAHILRSWGITAYAVTQRTGAKERREYLAAFKAGKIRCLTNNNVLTTGFDHPGIDLIAVFRKTVSPGLWVQMLGRGTRPLYAPGFDLEDLEQRRYALLMGGKQNCLVLDFADNVRSLGPINDPVIPKKRGPGMGDAPVKICEKKRLVSGNAGCGAYNHVSVRNCIGCGEEFATNVNFDRTSGQLELITTTAPIMEWFDVYTVTYQKHTKVGKPPMLRVLYQTAFRQFSEMLFLEHPVGSYPRKKSRDWWRTRTGAEPPETVDEALAIANRKELKEPHRIRVWLNKDYPEIINYEYD